MKEYPKVLIINDQSIFKNNATGITMRSLFQEWPENCIFELCLDDEKYNLNYCVNTKCVISLFPIQKLMRNVAHKNNVAVQQPKTISNSRDPIKNRINKRIRRLFINVADLSPMFMSSELCREIDKFCPNAIYTLGGNVSVMKLAVYISDHYDIPIIIHFMDDWPHYLQDERGFGQQFYKRKMLKWLRRLYKRTQRCIAISDQMAKVYKNETGIDHIAFMNSVNTKQLECSKKVQDDKLVAVYAGGLHLDRWQALIEVQNVLKQKAAQKKRDVEFRIYTKPEDIEKYASEFDPKITSFQKYINHNEIKSIYEEADILVHAEVANPLLVGYFRFSISTKIPEYLATGRTVLFYGPKEMGLYTYLRDSNCALVASTKDELSNCVDKIFSSDKSLDNMRKRAIEFVLAKHDQQKSSAQFLDLVFDCVREGRPKNGK